MCGRGAGPQACFASTTSLFGLSTFSRAQRGSLPRTGLSTHTTTPAGYGVEEQQFTRAKARTTHALPPRVPRILALSSPAAQRKGFLSGRGPPEIFSEALVSLQGPGAYVPFKSVAADLKQKPSFLCPLKAK